MLVMILCSVALRQCKGIGWGCSSFDCFLLGHKRRGCMLSKNLMAGIHTDGAKSRVVLCLK